MAFTQRAYQNFTRELAVDVSRLNAQAASRAIAQEARRHVSVVERQQGSRSGGIVPDHNSFVDGREDSRFESVRPDGVILLQWHYLTEAVIRVVRYLRTHGPEVSGEWKNSIVTYVGDDAVREDQRIPGNAREATVVVQAPYARRLEVGKRDNGKPYVLQVELHFVEQCVVRLRPELRRLGWAPRFTYVATSSSPELSAESMRRRHFTSRGIRVEKGARKVAGTQRNESAVKFPAIVLEPIKALSL